MTKHECVYKFIKVELEEEIKDIKLHSQFVNLELEKIELRINKLSELKILKNKELEQLQERLIRKKACLFALNESQPEKRLDK